MTWTPVSVLVYSIGLVLCLGPATDGSLYDILIDNTVCKFTECCNSHYIPYDIDALRKSLSKHMFGQPLAVELANILGAHKASFNNDSGDRKAEVISIHGGPGVGKTYAARMIAATLYRKGMDSSFVRVYQGQRVIDSENTLAGRARLYNEIGSIVKKCPTSLFIFDNADEMYSGIIDIIKPMVGTHRSVDGVDYRKAVFIFISNIGSPDITDVLMDLYYRGEMRYVELEHFTPILTGTMAGQLGKAHQHIDHYIPFLPLEREHLVQCARAEFEKYIDVTSPENVIVMEEVYNMVRNKYTYRPQKLPIFSDIGCKRLSKQILIVIEKHRQPSGEL